MFLFFCPIPSLFSFLSLYRRRQWEEEGRREVPSKVICNQGNGQSPSVCETVAPTREAPLNTSPAILYCSNVAATWTLTAKEQSRSQASPCTIPGRPNQTTMCLCPSTSVSPTRQISFHQCPIVVFNSSSSGRTKITSEATDPQRHTLIS